MELSIDSKIYSRDVLLAASYSILDKAHVILRSDESGDFKVTLIPREETLDLELEFNDLLVNYAAYYQKAQENADLKKLLIATSLYSLDDGQA